MSSIDSRSSRDIAANPLSSETILLLRRWLSRCEIEHPQCNLQDELNVPKRLVDVGFDADATLKLSQSFPCSPRYVALSHCWEHNRTLTTTRATILERSRDIPWNSLPKTF
jgi:hypothetical protein